MLKTTAIAEREKLLTAYGATAEQTAELLTYNTNRFDHSHLKLPLKLPLADEPQIAVWHQYVDEAQAQGIFSTLQKYLVQLRFPIQSEISKTDTYRNATLQGKALTTQLEATPLALEQPDTLQLLLHQSLAGKIPVVVVAHRPDFVALVQALAHRNEPHPIPDSMGACTIQGLNNWDRIRRYQQEWSKGKSAFEINFNWAAEFQQLLSDPSQYQDRLLILSQGYYSNILPESLHLSAQAWLDQALSIRLEHECAHYFTLRLLGQMSNNLWDELLADYWGILQATGTYRADWFLRFMGLEDYPNYRPGGRLENYIQDQQLSKPSVKILHQLLKQASENLEQFATTFAQELADCSLQMLSLVALTYLTLEQLAAANGSLQLTQTWQQLQLTD